MRTRPIALAPWLVLAALVAFACSSGGGGPTPPPPSPMVTGVAPAQARVGERVTIEGSDFGTSASAVTVTFRGETGDVESVTETGITATVPVIAPGPAQISVTVGGTAAGQADFTVAQTPLSITSVEPSAIRAGQDITIRGEGFLDPVAGLAPANGLTVQLVSDDVVEELPITSRSFSEIVAMTPGVVSPGSYSVRLQRGAETSLHTGLDVHLPTIGHSFAGRGAIVSNSFNGVPVGRETAYDFTLEETSYDFATRTGQLRMLLNGVSELEGEHVGGVINVITKDGANRFTGRLHFDAGGTARVQDAVFRATGGGGELRFEYGDARAWASELIQTGTMVIDFGDIVTGNGSLPEATYTYDAYDPLTWTPVAQVSGRLTGPWFQGTQPRDHFGTIEGVLRTFYDIEVGSTPIVSMRGFVTPLFSTQRVDLVGFDGSGQEVARETFDPVDNQGEADPFGFSLLNPTPGNIIQDFELQPAGDGFTTVFQAGVNWIEQPRAADRDARIELGF